MPLNIQDKNILCNRIMELICDNPEFQELDDYVRSEIGEGFEIMVAIDRTELLPLSGCKQK